MTELVSHEDASTIYSHVSNRDVQNLVFLYAQVAKRAISGSSFLNGDGVSAIGGEEKVDEYFSHGNSRQNAILSAASSSSPSWSSSSQEPASSSSTFIQELESILSGISTTRVKEKNGDRDTDIPSLKHKHPRSEENFDSRSHSRSIPPSLRQKTYKSALMQEEEDVQMRLANKILSNSRPPPTFAIYTNSPSTEQSSPRQHSSPPLFDGSVNGSCGNLIHLACIVDSPLILALLLILGADPMVRHSAFRRLPLHEAACAASNDCLSLLLKLSNETHKHSATFPCSMGHKPYPKNHSLPSILRHTLLLSLSNTHTPLQSALTLLQTYPIPLITPLTNPHTADGHGNTPLHWAAFKNSSTCLQTLMNYNADPNSRAQPSGWTPLHDAAYSNSCESLQILLANNADVDARASSGATPLCFASQEDAPDAVRILLEWGADPGIRCMGGGEQRGGGGNLFQSRFSGYTPLHYCAHYNAAKSAKILMQFGAKMDTVDLSDRLPIHVAVARGSSCVLKELLRAGARLERGEMPVTPPMPVRRRYQAVPVASTATPVVSSTPTTPVVSSPVLKAMIPVHPIQSSKPWNCLSQKSIDECRTLLSAVENCWSPETHTLFTPQDRKGVLELLRVGKRLEQNGTGIFLDLWPFVLSFCGRGWFVEDDDLNNFKLDGDDNHHGADEPKQLGRMLHQHTHF